MEFVRIEFPNNRIALVDGTQSGSTNQVLMIEEGHHEFALEGVLDFTPASQEILVQNTLSDDPLVVVFDPLNDE